MQSNRRGWRRRLRDADAGLCSFVVSFCAVTKVHRIAPSLVLFDDRRSRRHGRLSVTRCKSLNAVKVSESHFVAMVVLGDSIVRNRGVVNVFDAVNNYKYANERWKYALLLVLFCGALSFCTVYRCV